MSKRKHRSRSTVRTPAVLTPALPQTLAGVDEEIQRLSMHKAMMFDKLAASPDLNEVMKAVQYQEKSSTPGIADSNRAFLFAPDNEFYTGLGFKPAIKIVPFEFLRSMSRTPMVFSVIGTRINQILEYSNFSVNQDHPGWTIKRRISRFQKEYENTDKDKAAIEDIVTFLEDGGKNAKFTIHDDFHDFLKVFPRDMLELDQGCFELQRTRSGDLLTYNTVDSGTIRLLETIDPNYEEKMREKYEELTYQGVLYLPTYCQVWRERVLQNPKTKQPIIWYPWEMCMAIRNKSTDIMNNGYGQAELETLMRVVTWLLESMEYNGRFFTNGSNPRGFFTVKGGVDPRMLNDFRMAWRSMVTGWQNAHKVPIFEADKIDWVSMQNSNAEMEYTQWMEFLTLITCSVYKIDPSEMGFKFRQQTQLFGESGQKERLEHSKDKGLKPLLKVIQKNIDKFIVSEVNPNYQFVFTGIDLEDETLKLDNDIKKVTSGFVAMQDKFKEYTGRELDEEKDIILNPIYNQRQMQEQYGGQQMNQMVDRENGGEEVGVKNPMKEEKNPFNEFTEGIKKGTSADPITAELFRYIDKTFTK